MTEHVCVDCIAEGNKGKPRPSVMTRAPHRCATHRRAQLLAAKKRSRGTTVQRQRGISGEDSHALLIFQGGTCWLCQQATGATKSLAHDHDHKHCPGETSCAECLRGRLCGPCNQFIGRLGDSPEAAQRLVGYLTGDTPWRRLVAERWFSARWRNGAPVTVHHIDHPTEAWYNATWQAPSLEQHWNYTRLPTVVEMMLDITEPLPGGLLRGPTSLPVGP